ncbi:DHH family phosphoesterase [Geminocystis sp. CENA526]|uniref:DHH family phosphoesterase n=1 Tax=Geminocystis sp. CENA526 TaxID=1355871 RepID=UPI003D6ECAF1
MDNKLLDLDYYNSLSGDEFGQEMKRGIHRLHQAFINQEKVVIWGDSRIDGVMATTVLIEGLKSFFSGENNLLTHYISDVEGFTKENVDFLVQQNPHVIILVDLECDNFEVINYVQDLGIDIIIIDHHSLAIDRANVISCLNPLNFAKNHPFYHFSAVAIAYKFLESFYHKYSQKNTEELLDLVTLGLLANGDILQGEYLFWMLKGSELIDNKNRYAIKLFVDKCEHKKIDVIDYKQGLGMWLKVFNIINDSNLVIELFTTEDRSRRGRLMANVEKSYDTFLGLKEKILKQFHKKIANLDLFNDRVIVIEDNQWDKKLFPLIGSFISEKYQHPTILFSHNEGSIVRGFAYSCHNLDLWNILQNQQYLLISLSKYHQHIEISLSAENIELLTNNLNQQLRNTNPQLYSTKNTYLRVSIENLGKNLYKDLKLIKRFNIYQELPQLLIKNCWFTNIKDIKTQDISNENLAHNIVFFILNDDKNQQGFNGKWEGHYSSEINPNCRYDVICQLDYNQEKKIYFIKIIQLINIQNNTRFENNINYPLNILDYRHDIISLKTIHEEKIAVKECPLQWQEVFDKSQQAMTKNKDLVLAYTHNNNSEIEQLWITFIQLIKNSIKHNQLSSIEQICSTLSVKKETLSIILNSLDNLHITYTVIDDKIKFSENRSTFLPENYLKVKHLFEEIIAQENLQKTYFHQVPIMTIKEEITVNKIVNSE